MGENGKIETTNNSVSMLWFWIHHTVLFVAFPGFVIFFTFIRLSILTSIGMKFALELTGTVALVYVQWLLLSVASVHIRMLFDVRTRAR